MNNISKVSAKECCGCTACYSICPLQCIVMKRREDGFLYPIIDSNICVNCGKCLTTCPIVSPSSGEEISNAYIARTKDANVLKNSTSGGMSNPLGEYVIRQNGIVYGVCYDKDFRVTYSSACKNAELSKFQGSKYVQSDMGDTYKEIRKNLENDRMVLFCGLPCQVSGLKRYLGKDYKKLITVGLVCHGTPSPLVFQKYLEYLSQKYHSSVKKVVFRKKIYGYHSSAMCVEFTNGSRYIASGRVDYMLLAFFEGLSSRESCYQCQFKGRKRTSDLTLYDGWHYNKLTGKKDDDKGYTIILVHTEKGKETIDKIGDNLFIEQVDIDSAIIADGSMIEHQPERHEKRDTFLSLVHTYGIDIAIKQCYHITKGDRLKEFSRKYLYKMGLLTMLKRFKNK